MLAVLENMACCALISVSIFSNSLIKKLLLKDHLIEPRIWGGRELPY